VLILAAAGLGLGFLFFVLFAFQQFGLAFLLLLVGGAGLAFLSYPILITLERPVRITPEQAVRDYFAAPLPPLSALPPDVAASERRRTRLGVVRVSRGGSKAYWTGRLAEMKAGRASGMTPLKFQGRRIPRGEECGQVGSRGGVHTVKVSVRGQQDDGPVETFSIQATLIKGPDNMWYLDRGTLP